MQAAASTELLHKHVCLLSLARRAQDAVQVLQPGYCPCASRQSGSGHPLQWHTDTHQSPAARSLHASQCFASLHWLASCFNATAACNWTAAHELSCVHVLAIVYQLMGRGAEST